MAIMVIIAMVMPLIFIQMIRSGMALLFQLVIEKKENLEEIARKEPLRCFTQRVLRAHRVILPVLAPAHLLVLRVEDARHVENNLTLPH